LAAAAVAVVPVIMAIVLGIALSGGSKRATAANLPPIGHHNSANALPGATDVYNLFKGIPQSGLTLGASNAPATMTEFIDLQCPNCRTFETTQMPTIVRDYVRTGKLNIKMQPWSILSPPDSPRGQAATIAASLQNKAFPFAAMLYLNQGLEDTGWLTNNMVGAAASSVDGLKPQRVLDDLASSKVKTLVTDVDGTASAQNFDATPTILLNHNGQRPRVVSVGVPDLGTLESQIEAAVRS
jgi:protein-disulfide isomerase